MRLTVLDLSCTHMTTEKFDAIVLNTRGTLKVLNVSCNDITHFPHLFHATDFEILDVSFNKIQQIPQSLLLTIPHTFIYIAPFDLGLG